MKRTKTIPWNPIEHLSSDAAVAAYMEAALVDGEPHVIVAALNDIAIAQLIKSTSSVTKDNEFE